METAPFGMIAAFADDVTNAWSIGSLGAIGEFMRDADEPTRIRRGAGLLEIVTSRGGLRIAPMAPLRPIACDRRATRGEASGGALAFCVPVPPDMPMGVRSLGPDHEALRAECRGDRLFDLGVGFGAVRMTQRTADADLVAALEEAEGRPLPFCPAILTEAMRAQPHRVLLSPAGRLEVYQPIPVPGGSSPEGPHTHLLPTLVVRARPHPPGAPIPEGWQSALTLHSASRDAA